ncbi:cytochrome c peroxidase [Pontibacter sp. G13]|uniref:cytochrome-c peroxidase n=1 Tax=Pontibacter sp. G13 TaxID=3074898 RepID=UPI00288C1B0E|nr:cytochrome c peroxidase [Pontibacter sp. G13]WNJ17419.1 cytochrome c peroxidase [Pontibacter sp. G13]
MSRNLVFILIGLCALLIARCSTTAPDQLESEVLDTSIQALPLEVISPADNPTTPEKVALGKLLFYDPILSGNKDVACATCHHPNHGYAEFRDLSIGVNGTGLSSKRKFNTPNDIPFVKRNAHTILNTAFNGINPKNEYQPDQAPMFWDSRVNSLESQALEPIKALEEMRGRAYEQDEILDEVVRRLKEIPTYQALFDQAFLEEDAISIANLGKALAAFERSLVTPNTRFDRYLRGDEDALSFSEKDGFRRFKNVGCANCHNGSMLSDFKPHVLGMQENNKLAAPDSGTQGTFGFRTPSLRNLRFTSPYMHNGKFYSLKGVLEFYEELAGGQSRNKHVPKEQLDPLIKKLTITMQDIGPIVSFFNALNDTTFDRSIPESVPSGLNVGGNIE